jgi:phosphoadenosine phosphosulfate reductase
MISLDQKIAKAKQVILKAAKKWPAKSIAVAWTGGKDSTVLLHLVRETFENKVPFKVFFNDSTLEFPEIYQFVKQLSNNWQLDLIWQKHLPEDLEAYHNQLSYTRRVLIEHPTGEISCKKNLRGLTTLVKPPRLDTINNDRTPEVNLKAIKEQAMEILRLAKINAINYAISKYTFKAFISGIRHDKSLGEAPFTKPVDDKNAPERAGRETTKEKTMERLRQLGYW